MLTVHILIKGKVQGVFFRATAKEKAELLNVKGWVRNTPSGDVEITATGAAEKVNELIEWCHQGPARAKVSEVKAQEKEPENFERFTILR